MLIFLVGKASPAWRLVPCSVPQLAPAVVAAGAGRIPEPWGCSAPQLQETPSPLGGCATAAIWLRAQARLGLSSPAGQGCHCPCHTGSPGRGCSHRITAVPLLPGTANPPGLASCCGQHWAALAGSLHRQHRKCWGREGSTSLLEKNWGTKIPKHVGWLFLLAAVAPGCCPYLAGWAGW